jgi:hypothetical protein
MKMGLTEGVRCLRKGITEVLIRFPKQSLHSCNDVQGNARFTTAFFCERNKSAGVYLKFWSSQNIVCLMKIPIPMPEMGLYDISRYVAIPVDQKPA